jgi:hypothetical protein
MSKLRQTGEGVAAANRRRGFPVMVGRRQGRKVERQGMFLLDRVTRATTGRGYFTSTFYLGRQWVIELINNSMKHIICIYIFIYLIVVNKNVS